MRGIHGMLQMCIRDRLQGTETLSLRVDRHVENTKKVVEFLSQDPHVASVNHPSLPDHPDHELYQRYFPCLLYTSPRMAPSCWATLAR